MNQSDVTTAAIVQGLERLGLRPPCHLMVHASLSKFGQVADGATTVVAALRETAGADGAAIIPSFRDAIRSEHYALQQCRSNCPQTLCTSHERGYTGAIGEAVRQQPDAVRSCHPTHSWVGIGAGAAGLLDGHHVSRTPCGTESPYFRLMEQSGTILLLGVGVNSITNVHAVEDARNVPYLSAIDPPNRHATYTTSGRRIQYRFPEMLHTTLENAGILRANAKSVLQPAWPSMPGASVRFSGWLPKMIPGASCYGRTETHTNLSKTRGGKRRGWAKFGGETRTRMPGSSCSSRPAGHVNRSCFNRLPRYTPIVQPIEALFAATIAVRPMTFRRGNRLTSIPSTNQVWRLVVSVTGECRDERTHLNRSAAGRIINIASVQAFRGGGGPAYLGSKTAVINFMRDLAMQLAQHGTTVNAICPGYIETAVQDDQTPDQIEVARANIPLPRYSERRTSNPTRFSALLTNSGQRPSRRRWVLSWAVPTASPQRSTASLLLVPGGKGRTRFRRGQ